MNVDRTRSAIEEDFSLEEQNFQSVIDMETEDDYSRGNIVLYSNLLAYSAATTPATTVLLSPANYFLEWLDLTIAFGNITFSPGPNQMSVGFNLVTSVSNVTLFYYVFESDNFTSPGSVNFPINQHFGIDNQVLLPRNEGVNLQITVSIFGNTGVTGSDFTFAINIYGRIVP